MTIGFVLNIQRGHIIPQYHLVYGYLFTMALNAESSGVDATCNVTDSMWE